MCVGIEARFYDPTVGRFISEDPIGFGGGDVNLYVYCGNNPVLYMDPLGLLDLFIGVEGDLVGILGLEGGVGIVIDTDHLGDSGIFGTIGPAAGGNVGGAISGGIVKEIEGWSYNFDANLGMVSPVISMDSQGFNGISVGYGPGAGLSASATYTSTYSVKEMYNDAKSLWNNVAGNTNSMKSRKP